MWSGLTDQFRKDMSPWVKQAPTTAIRKGIDDAEIIEGAETLGGRPASTCEIAGIVGMLCSDESVWCTGPVICANGVSK